MTRSCQRPRWDRTVVPALLFPRQLRDYGAVVGWAANMRAMPIIHRGATLTPHFRDFLPAWATRQPWYLGPDQPSLRPVGYYRFEDPAGAVGIETHLVTDGSALYQIPMTYRDAPLDGAEAALISTTEHSVLGQRWIYDATADPVWAAELVRVVGTNGAAELSLKPGAGRTEACGRRLAPAAPKAVAAGAVVADLTPADVSIDLHRVLRAGEPPTEAGLLGVLLGSWQPAGEGGPTVQGCLAVLRSRPVVARPGSATQPGPAA
jgi:hypothetical protein